MKEYVSLKGPRLNHRIKKTNEMEISNLTDKELKIMVIKSPLISGEE